MRKLYPLISYLFLGVILAVTLGYFTNQITPQILKDFLDRHFVKLILALVALAGLWVWSWRDHVRLEREKLRKQLEAEWYLFKAAKDLEPADFGFKEVQKGYEPTGDELRLFYTDIYFPRNLVPVGAKGPLTTEFELLERMKGDVGPDDYIRRLAVVGEPTEGKTVIAYRLLKELEGWTVVSPKHSGLPSDAAIQHLGKRPVVLFLEDLNEYVGQRADIKELHTQLHKQTDGRCLVLALCSLGPELTDVKKATKSSIANFFAEMPHKYELVELTEDEKKNLAAELGKPLNEGEEELYPTPGTIVDSKMFEKQRQRLEHLSLEQTEVLNTLRLFYQVGLRPFRTTRLELVLNKMYPSRPNRHLGDCLEELKKLRFIKSYDSQQVQPNIAYLKNLVGKQSADLEHSLENVLTENKDIEGLFGIANHWYTQKNLDHAEEICRRVIELDPNYARAWYNLGGLLKDLNRKDEAETAYKKALEVDPNYAAAWSNLGLLLKDLNRKDEAETAYKKALELDPNLAAAWSNLGVLLNDLNRKDEALRAFAQLLRFGPSQYAQTIKAFRFVLGGQNTNDPKLFCYVWCLRKQYPLIEEALYQLLFVDLEFDKYGCVGYNCEAQQ